MRRTPLAIVGATATAALLTVGLGLAPAAQAYPPGKDQTTTTNKDTVKPGGKAKVGVKNAQPGCRVKFSVVNKKGKEVDSRTGEVDADGRANRILSFPEKPGTYTIVSSVYGKGCAESESSTDVQVG